MSPVPAPVSLTAPTRLAIWLIAANAALLVASNAGGSKMISVYGGLAASATVFSYAVTFVMADVINELFGIRIARLNVNVGLAGLALSVIFFQISIAAPPAAFWPNQAAYEATLGLGPRLLAGGWSAYIISN